VISRIPRCVARRDRRNLIVTGTPEDWIMMMTAANRDARLSVGVIGTGRVGSILGAALTILGARAGLKRDRAVGHAAAAALPIESR
jgi:hypothetical protein